MNRTQSSIRASLPVSLIAAALAWAAHSDALAQFYVAPAPSGKSTNPGTLSAPFLTLGQAQTAMRNSSTKTTYLRAGLYSISQPFILTSADNGETWQYYPADGPDTAILDGGSSSPTTGANPGVLGIDGGSNITISGLKIQNHQQWGIAIHGGVADPTLGNGVVFLSAVPNAVGNVIMNNFIQNGWTTANAGWGGGGIVSHAYGQITIKNNVVQNQYGGGIRANSSAAYDIENNVVLNTNINTGDSGAIYTQNIAGVQSPPVTPRNTVKNNFIRDYQGNDGIGNNPARDVAIYFDRGSSDANVTGNIIAASANVVHSTNAFFVSGHDIAISGNIIDLGSTAQILNMAYEQYISTDVVNNNAVTGNIFIGNWSGGQLSGSFGAEEVAYATGGSPAAPTISNNVYHNYSAGSLATNGNVTSDSHPVLLDPQIFSGAYQITAGSPVYASPVNFPAIVGGWGPPGYVIPQTGTAPSCGVFVEAESLSVVAQTAGITARIGTDPSMSGGAGAFFDATAANQFVTYDVPSITAGTYDVRIGIKTFNNKGQWQLAISKIDNQANAVNQGPVVDEYSSSPVYDYVDLGTWVPGSTGDKAFKFTVTGKNASSSAYGIAIDYIELIPQN